VQKTAVAEGLPETEVLRIVLALLEVRRTERMVMSDADRGLLQQAERRLAREAAARPEEYLGAYRAMRAMTAGAMGGPAGGRGVVSDIPVIERAIRKLLPVAEAVPAAGQRAADAGLSQLYFRHLNDPAGKP